ncbi:gas vesicle protein GvpG [Fictibacillus sp. WQ 8-8]|uniref:Gas vesicle protein GvpG n=1 Tax=Fictibacillus marinisediminis TaxID=2878389 RepID=A0A9X1XEQ1_9BACL|nr:MULTISPECIES: gas vesicle protein GvpG [Fictibacillus]SFD45533.1 Gas vesicle protein G [Bacillus sp. OV194]MCK6258515.1 gas vesicle protein GvpG [Fictibacillus marinisediminis]MCQ6264241.1 gas vesicle protein GvpG [Fictibacillus sp. WQ 8-8]MED2974948.1 gas vesicle protein GvpG [Fictibacillus sp. B-59209]UZJ79844.1 gas vesicle protein GvpG [Fictibacillus sp. KU28468]
MIHKLLMSPMNLVIKVGEKVKEEVDRELYDISFIQQKLIQLQMMYELEEIPEEVYKEQEEVLLVRYEIAKQREMEEWENLTKKQK